jgi:glycine cleavage system transcriptional repressor
MTDQTQQILPKQWFMMTLVGKDQPGIVAKTSTALFKAGCNFGEASMMRLGGNFSIMLMVQYAGTTEELSEQIEPVAEALSLRLHIDPIEGQLHEHRIPDVRISVYGADRAGIVAQVTTALYGAGLDIFDLESDVAGTDEKPVYIMHIEGRAAHGMEKLQQALATLEPDIKVTLQPIDTMVG